MKTEAIKQAIVSNFRTISEKAKVAPEKEHLYPVWGLNYKKSGTDGFVSQFGVVERNGAKIDIVNGEVQQVKKPFYMTWKRTLKKINTMMENINANIDNEQVVTKQIVNILCFPKEFVKKLQKIEQKHGK